MSYKWRLWCTVHGWVYDWADIPITQCPTENSDSVDTTKTFKVGEEYAVVTIVPTEVKIKNGSYERVASIIYDPTNRGLLHRVKIMSYMDSGTTSYDVEIYDRTNNTSLIEANFTNIEDFDEQNLGIIQSPPEEKFYMEVNIKRTGTGKKYAHISQIILYTRKETS